MCRLDLGHGRPTFSAAASAEIDAAGFGVHGGEKRRGGVGGEGEPQKCSGGLGFSTSLSSVIGAVGDAVGASICLRRKESSVLVLQGILLICKDVPYIIATALYAELSSHSNGTTEEEEGIEDVECERDRSARQNTLECARYQDEEGQHGEYCDKHGVVDDGWIARVRLCDHIANQRHDEERPEEL